MKSNWLCASTLFLCLLFSIPGQSYAQKYSPEFQALLNQIQQNYLAQKGENLSSMRNQFPAVVAALVGHALRQQVVHVQQNPSLNNRFKNLQQEARVYITDLARTTTYRGRNEDGSAVASPENLLFIMNKFFQGQEDAVILQHYGVRIGTMPSVLAASRKPEKPIGPSLDPYEKPKETNKIELFGKVAPPVKGPDKCDGPTYWSPQCDGYRQQKEAEAEAARQKSKALNPDGIQGNWFARQRKLQLKIWKQGDTYLGSSSGTTSWSYNFKPNAVCLRIKYAGAGKDGPVYKGQYYATSGTTAPDRWEDITFHYYLRSGKEVFSEGPSSSPGMKDFDR